MAENPTPHHRHGLFGKFGWNEATLMALVLAVGYIVSSTTFQTRTEDFEATAVWRMDRIEAGYKAADTQLRNDLDQYRAESRSLQIELARLQTTLTHLEESVQTIHDKVDLLLTRIGGASRRTEQ